MTDFKCKILSQIYYNDNSDWGVYSVSTQENIEGSSYNPFTEEYNVKIVGITGRLNIGCEYQIKGEFEISKQYKSSQYKVMNITNNYNIEPNIFNGNMGIVQKISKDNMIVHFVGIGRVDIPSDWYNNIILAYASTCHKLQGSEFDIVVVGVDMSAFKLLSNQWIYTAITRAKKKCYLNCQLTALNTAISNMITTNRNTFFKDYDKYLQQGIE